MAFEHRDLRTSPTDVLRLALESGSAVQTVRNFLAGKRMRCTTFDRIEAAARRLNLSVSH